MNAKSVSGTGGFGLALPSLELGGAGVVKSVCRPSDRKIPPRGFVLSRAALASVNVCGGGAGVGEDGGGVGAFESGREDTGVSRSAFEADGAGVDVDGREEGVIVSEIRGEGAAASGSTMVMGILLRFGGAVAVSVGFNGGGEDTSSGWRCRR